MSNQRSTPSKRLSPAAWDALLEALAVFYWFRSDFEMFVRSELAATSELLARLSFSESKRIVATELVKAMRKQEARYQDLAIDLLVRLSQFDRSFPKLARLEDGALKVAAAQAALDEVQKVVAVHSKQAEAREQVRVEAARDAEARDLRRTHDELLRALKERFTEMWSMTDHQARGRQFEGLLNELFALVDLQPRASYSLECEQIDGAFTFQTDDYLLEARWWDSPLQPKELNDFTMKIQAKAKNVLGLMIAVGGFTQGAIKKHSHGTSLILLDGTDLFAVLDGRISFAEMLERKRRHAAETGSPMLSVSEMMG